MESRYLINQARRYVRGGDTRIGIYSAKAIRDNVAKLQKEADIRFHMGDAEKHADINAIVNGLRPGHDRPPSWILKSLKNIGDSIKDKGFWRSLKQFSQTTNNHARASEGLTEVYLAMNDMGAHRNSLMNSYAGLRPLMNKLREWGVLNKPGTDRDIINERHSNQLTEASLHLQLDKLDGYYEDSEIQKVLRSGTDGIIKFFRDYNNHIKRDGHPSGATDEKLRLEDKESYSVTDAEGNKTQYRSGWWVLSRVLDNKQLVDRETLKINEDVWKLYQDFLPTFDEVSNFMRTDPKYKARDGLDKPTGIKAMIAERKEQGLGNLNDIPWKLYLEGRLTVSESKKDVYLNTVSGYYELIANQTNEFFGTLDESHTEKGNLNDKDYTQFKDNLKTLQKTIRNLSYLNLDMDALKSSIPPVAKTKPFNDKVKNAMDVIRKYDT